MEIKKVNLDRLYLSSSQIEKKQNFQYVLNCTKKTKHTAWNSPFFYGAIGLSSIAATAISGAEVINQFDLNDKITTSEIQIINENEYAEKSVKAEFRIVSFSRNKTNQ